MVIDTDTVPALCERSPEHPEAPPARHTTNAGYVHGQAPAMRSTVTGPEVRCDADSYTGLMAHLV